METTRVRERLAREDGFTLIELLVVIVIVGILMAIAILSYLTLQHESGPGECPLRRPGR